MREFIVNQAQAGRTRTVSLYCTCLQHTVYADVIGCYTCVQNGRNALGNNVLIDTVIMTIRILYILL